MAEVFLAKQVGIGGFEKPVALKRIQRQLLEIRHQAIELFLNEAKIAGRLTHPNIVQVLDVGEAQGALYLAMEYVHGKDLRKVIKKLQQIRTILSLGDACYIVREVAQALDHAYWSTDMTGQRLAVVHRDVSPHNIILSYGGAVKLLDFGVAMSAVTEHAETMIVGKWLYMSPEATANQHIDHRSDLFSLGVILYLLCSGYMPFTGSTPREIVKKIRTGEYRPLHELVAVPDRLAMLVGRLLAPNPDDRPQRGQEVAAELTDIARQYGIESSAPGLAYVLAQLFPSESSGASEQRTSSIREIVRTIPEDVGSFTAKEKSPVSITPGSGSISSSSKALAPVDVSETWRQRTGAPLPPAATAAPEAPEPAAQAAPVTPPHQSHPRPATPPHQSHPRPVTPVPRSSRPEMEISRRSQPILPQPIARPPAPRGSALRTVIVIVLATAATLAGAAYVLGYI
jgi:serine/threonine protein kinase